MAFILRYSNLILVQEQEKENNGAVYTFWGVKNL